MTLLVLATLARFTLQVQILRFSHTSSTFFPSAPISFFTVLYFGGAFLGAKEASMFYQRFKKRVRNGEIMRLNVSALEAFMNGKTLMLSPKERNVADVFDDECARHALRGDPACARRSSPCKASRR